MTHNLHNKFFSLPPWHFVLQKFPSLLHPQVLLMEQSVRHRQTLEPPSTFDRLLASWILRSFKNPSFVSLILMFLASSFLEIPKHFGVVAFASNPLLCTPCICSVLHHLLDLYMFSLDIFLHILYLCLWLLLWFYQFESNKCPQLPAPP